MQGSDQQVKEIFNSFDKDGNGYLEPAEIQKVSQELGKPLTQNELNKVIKMIDLNKDGKISFEEFNIWWKHGVTGKFEELVYLRMKSLQMLNKAQLKIAKLGATLENKYEKGISNHFFGIQVGDFPPQSYLSFKLLSGNDHCQVSKDLLARAGISGDSPAVILKLKVGNSELAKEQFENIFSTLMDMINSFAPAEIADQIQQTVKFFYDTPSPDFLTVLITVDHPLIQDIVEQQAQMLSSILPPEFTQQLNVTFSDAFCFRDIVKNAAAPIKDLQIRGLSFNVEARLEKALLKQLTNMLYSQMDKSKDNFSEKVYKMCKYYIPLFLLNGSKAVLNFRSLEDAKEILGKKIMNKIEQSSPGSSLKEGLQILKEQGMGEQLLSFMDEIPVVQDVLDAFQNNCLGDVSLIIQAPKNSLTVNLNSEGFGELIDFAINSIK